MNKQIEKHELLIAGPCSAESRAQVFRTAEALLPAAPDYFRAGLWKPRSRPDSFQGIGEEGAYWMDEVRAIFNIKIITEVITPEHVEIALDHFFDAIWIGARTTVNPVYVGEIFQALDGIRLPIFIKNPVSPDINLWLGAVERCLKAGQREVYAVHRGFSVYNAGGYRNMPIWQLVSEFRKAMPDVPIICDPSHMGGNTMRAEQIIRYTRNTIYSGYMVESHYDPGIALSDNDQQLEPSIMNQLFNRRKLVDFSTYSSNN